MRRGQLRGHLEISEELSARGSANAFDTSAEASRGAVNTPQGDIRRLVRERPARVPRAQKRGGVRRKGEEGAKKNKKKRHLPETGALDRSALDQL